MFETYLNLKLWELRKFSMLLGCNPTYVKCFFDLYYSGLLPFLKKASSPKHISEFKGATIGIDVYCWLHKGAFGN